MKKQKLLTQKEYAHRRGVTQQAINRAIHQGQIPTHGGRINAQEADSALADAASDHGTTLAAATLRWRLATAVLKELEVGLRKGSLVDVDYVEAAQSEVNASITRTLLAIPTRLTPRLVGLTSPAKIKLILQEEISQCLSHLREVAVPGGAAKVGEYE